MFGVFCGYRWQKLELPDLKLQELDRTGIWKCLRQNKRNYVLISIILRADSVTTYAYLIQNFVP